MSDPESPPQAASPTVPAAGSLVGSWRVSGDGAECALEVFENADLTLVDPGIPMLGARTIGTCPGLDGISGLQPIPLGFALVRENSSATTFEEIGPGRFRSIDQVWTVSRD